MADILFQILIYLGAAVIAVPLAARLGLGSVLGYLVAGIAIGPIFGLVGSETKDVQHVAEFGIVMMLFLIGLSLDPRALWDMRHRLLGLGGLQLVLTTGGIMLGAMALGYPAATGLVIGLILALSSTAIVLQTLSERGLIKSRGRRSIFAVLLTQDIAVIPILALLPLLTVQQQLSQTGGTSNTLQQPAPTTPHGQSVENGLGLTILEGLPGWGVDIGDTEYRGGDYSCRCLFYPTDFSIHPRHGITRDVYRSCPVNCDWHQRSDDHRWAVTGAWRVSGRCRARQ